MYMYVCRCIYVYSYPGISFVSLKSSDEVEQRCSRGNLSTSKISRTLSPPLPLPRSRDPQCNLPGEYLEKREKLMRQSPRVCNRM